MDQALDFSVSKKPNSSQVLNSPNEKNDNNELSKDITDETAPPNEVYMKLKRELSYAEALELLNDPKDQPILTQIPPRPLKMNTVYLYDTSKSNHPYWNNDGKSWIWRRMRKEPMRSDTKLVCQRQYKLRHNGDEVDCFRDEIWEANGDPKQPSAWQPTRVIVLYHGTFDVNRAINLPHGKLSS